MKQNLQEMNIFKINEGKLSVDITKNEFTFEEIYKLSLETKLSLRDLVISVVEANICYTARSFSKSVLSGEFTKVKQTILSGYLFNYNDNLYFTNRTYSIVDKDMLTDNVVNKLYELLIQNGEWDIARRLSSKGLYYKFTKLNDKNINYLLGDFNEEILNPDIYAREIYKGLDEKSKNTVRDLMVKNYLKIVSIYKESKEQGLEVVLEGGYSFSVFKQLSDDEISWNIYGISDIYKEFDQEYQSLVSNALQEIK